MEAAAEKAALERGKRLSKRGTGRLHAFALDVALCCTVRHVGDVVSMGSPPIRSMATVLLNPDFLCRIEARCCDCIRHPPRVPSEAEGTWSRLRAVLAHLARHRDAELALAVSRLALHPAAVSVFLGTSRQFRFRHLLSGVLRPPCSSFLSKRFALKMR